MSIYITATVNSKPGQQEKLKGLLLELVNESRKEAACLQYDLHQSLDNPELFIFQEEWANKEGIDFHESQPHIAKFIKESASLIQGNLAVYKTAKLA